MYSGFNKVYTEHIEYYLMGICARACVWGLGLITKGDIFGGIFFHVWKGAIVRRELRRLYNNCQVT